MEQELKVKISGDLDGLKKAVNESVSELDRLNSSQDRVKQGLGSLNAESLRLEKSLRDLNASFQSGKINNTQFKAEQDKLQNALMANRTESNAYRRELNRLSTEMTRAKAATDNQSKAISVNTVEIKKNENALVRHVYAQRAALSASNNLSRSLTAVAVGRGNAAASIGVATRQMATLATTGVGLTGGMRALAASFMGPGGVIIALSAVGTVLTSYISEQIRANREARDGAAAADVYVKSLGGIATAQAVVTRTLAESPYQQAVKDIEELKIMVDLAKEGIVDKDVVVKHYNDTLKDAAGEVRSLGEVESFLVDKSDAYIKAMMFRAAANLALEDASKKAYEAQIELSKPIPAPDIQFGVIGQNIDVIAEDYRRATGFAREAVQKDVAEIAKEGDKFLEIARGFMTQFANISNEFGLFPGSSQTKGLSKFAQEAQKIENDLRTKFKQGRDKELEETAIRFEKMQELAKGNASDLALVEELRRQYVAEVNRKWDALEQDERNKAFQAELDAELKHEQALESAIEKNRERIRLAAMEGRSRELAEIQIHYDNLYQLAEGNDVAMADLQQQHREDIARINREWNEKEQEEFRRSQEQFQALVKRNSRMLSGQLSGVFETILTDGENSFEKLGDAFKKMVIRMLAEAAALRIISALFGGMTLGAGGGVAGFLGGLLTGGRSFGQSVSGGIPAMPSGSFNMSAPKVSPLSNHVVTIIPDVKVSGSDLRLVFNRANTSNNLFNGGR